MTYLNGILQRNMLLIFPNLAPMIVPRSYFQPVYDIKRRINRNVRTLIKQRNSMEKKVESKEDMTFMDHTRQLASNDGEDGIYTESQEIADIMLMFL